MIVGIEIMMVEWFSMSHNTKLDLIWIIPEILGELILFGVIPIILVFQLDTVGIFSLDGLTYLSLITLLVKELKNLNGLSELTKVKWTKEG